MKSLKKVVYLLIAVSFMFTLSACGNDNEKNNNNIQKNQEINSEYGNTMSNIQNDGLITTDGKNIYYNNSKGLFVNSLSGGESKSISPDYAEQINVMNDWVYYYSTSPSGDYKGLWKVKTDGKELTMLRDGTIYNLIVTNEWIYFSQKVNPNSNTPSLVKMDIENNLVQPEHIYEGRTEHLNLENEWFYFYSSMEGGICKIKTNGEEFKKIYSVDEGKLEYMVVYKNSIYYVLDDKIYSMNIDGSDNTMLLDLTSLDLFFRSFNINDEYIYISNSDKLYRLNINSKEFETLNCKLESQKQSKYGNTLEIKRLQVINDNLYFLQEFDDFDIGIFKFNTETNVFSKFE